ncbi:MAG: methyltransferase domain-containing protein [Pseudomonadota bacterium]
MKSALKKLLFGDAKSSAVPPPAGELSWQCNICGAPNKCLVANLERESAPCSSCHAILRYRTIAAVLTLRLFGKVMVLADLPLQQQIKGIGMSDADPYANLLPMKFSYTNTYYHCEPLLDIKNPAPQWLGNNDFVITSDVFEHVPPPIQEAFDNLYTLLKPGGVVIFSVPFCHDAETHEHYPSLHQFKLRQEQNGDWVLENVTTEGRHEEFRHLFFHGGPGSTLELRMFAFAALQRHFAQAGFEDLRVHSEPYFEHGIYWWSDWHLILSAKKPTA